MAVHRERLYRGPRWLGLGAERAARRACASAADAIHALTDGTAEVVIADAREGPPLAAAVRARRDLASAHIVVCAALDAPHELREALDAGADDVMRIPFEPEVLAARVAAGLRAARPASQ